MRKRKCQTLANEKSLEVLGDAKERDAFAWAFDKIIGEARATRIFVDKAGAPVARSEPKKRLRMILGAH